MRYAEVSASWGVIRVGFWEEAALVQNDPCFEWRLHIAHLQEALTSLLQARQAGLILLSPTDEETKEQLSQIIQQHPDLPETVRRFLHPRKPLSPG